jgi:hypothetical protein
MAKRYYLAPVIGSGLSMDDARRPDLPLDVPFNYSAVINDGVQWCVVIVAQPDHALMQNSTKLVPLPVFPLDTLLADVPQNQRNAFVQRCQTRLGINVDLSQFTTYRQMLRAIARRLDANFREQTLDVSD